MPFNTGITEVFASENMLQAVGTRSTTSGQPHGVVYLAEAYPMFGGQLYDLLAFTITSESPGPVLVDPPPRVRSFVTETIGSMSEQVRVMPVDNQTDEAFFLGADLDTAQLTTFRETLDPNTIASVRYPIPINSMDDLDEYRGRTNLGRINDAFPRAQVLRASDISTWPDLNLREWLQWLVNAWEGEFPWLRFEPIPDLRFPIPGGEYGHSQGIVLMPALVIPQDTGNRLSIRDILERLLSLIPSALRQTASGSLEIIPFYGPDAPSEPALVLGLEDIIDLDRSKADPSQLYNRAVVTSRGWAFTPNQQLNEPSFAVQSWFRRGFLDDEDVIPANRVEFPQPDSGLFAEGELGTQHFIHIAGGHEVTLEYTVSIYSALAGSQSNPTPNNPSALIHEGTENGTVTIFRDGMQQGFQATVWVLFSPITYTWSFRWIDDGLLISVRSNARGSYFGTSLRLVASILQFDIVGEAFVQSNASVTGTFGLYQGKVPQDTLPGPGGTNALQTSEDLFGPRELQVSTDIFTLTPGQAQDIAQALVLHHINPRTIRRMEQSWWNGYRVKPDHIGRLIQLPNSEVGRLMTRTYQDDHTHHTLRSDIEVVLTTPAVEIGDLLLTDSGDFLTFDDGTLVGRS